MDTPTASDVRARSPLLRQRYPAPAAGADEDASLVAAIEDAAALVATWTGRLIAPVTEGEEVPAGLVGTARRAVARMAERIDSAVSAGEAGKAALGRRRRSISAGPWSESYFAPGELSLKNGMATITGDDVLDALLWALATQDAREAWVALATGVQPPAGGVDAFDYRLQGGSFGAALGPRWRRI